MARGSAERDGPPPTLPRSRRPLPQTPRGRRAATRPANLAAHAPWPQPVRPNRALRPEAPSFPLRPNRAPRPEAAPLLFVRTAPSVPKTAPPFIRPDRAPFGSRPAPCLPEPRAAPGVGQPHPSEPPPPFRATPRSPLPSFPRKREPTPPPMRHSTAVAPRLRDSNSRGREAHANRIIRPGTRSPTRNRPEANLSPSRKTRVERSATAPVL